MVNFDYDPVNKVMKVTFIGRMDTLAVQKISEMVQINLTFKENLQEDQIVFNLHDVDYISSSFIRICVGVAKQAGTGKFKIAGCQPFIRKTFTISGLDDLLNIS